MAGDESLQAERPKARNARAARHNVRVQREDFASPPADEGIVGLRGPAWEATRAMARRHWGPWIFRPSLRRGNLTSIE